MANANIIIHLPSHRRTALKIESETREAQDAYDSNIGDYVRFLQAEADKAGFVVSTDQSDVDAVFSIEESDHAQKKAAHDWLETQPDLWNWIP